MWNHDLWVSTNGVPIGSPVGPHLAVLGLQYALQPQISVITDNARYYGAYIDDHLGISATNKIVKHLHSHYESKHLAQSITLQQQQYNKDSSYNNTDDITTTVQLLLFLVINKLLKCCHNHWRL